MKKTLLEVYALAVCFATLVCFTISLGYGIYGLVKISAPELTMPAYTFNKHQSNDAFKKSCSKDTPEQTEEEITKLRLESYERAIRGHKRTAAQNFIWALIVILVDIIVFIPHWIIAKRARLSAE